MAYAFSVPRFRNETSRILSKNVIPTIYLAIASKYMNEVAPQVLIRLSFTLETFTYLSNLSHAPL
jgi:hypothetical protein